MPLVVVEGVGSGALPAARRATVLVWVEAPYDAADATAGWSATATRSLPTGRRWARAEEVHFAEHRTRERADVVVDGTGRRPARVIG